MADSKAQDHGQAEVQARFDEATAKGYFGEVPDDKPNEAYTVAGVTKDMPKRAAVKDEKGGKA